MTTETTKTTALEWLVSDQERFAHVLCRRCGGFLKTDFVERLPRPWKQLPPDGDDGVCFYNDETFVVLETPPAECSPAAKRVFAANQSVFAVCGCRISWERRRVILRKFRIYATRYKDDIDATLSSKLEKLLATRRGGDLLDMDDGSF
ncbi:unnamed protein product [Aphanomyces euteiches]|uniref:Uncharacterized protein n=1 Tax=Aphanomyces euteiches TaxID=100861 RepID=A0A6G0W5Z6_9STRA|nr:hypothetical protein Ae201684_018380 [Aphanomyces euteiches]KAH9097528.1 hypothetical protein Ae201684P_001006 [Aphanomyces euteiches]KAH9140011.1 hypothetical protein AeRB84_015736 [Aphanomyces euteiches]